MSKASPLTAEEKADLEAKKKAEYDARVLKRATQKSSFRGFLW